MSVGVSPRIRFGPYAFDTETGELTKSGHRTALRPQAAHVLTYLASHSGQLVTREELREHVWGSETYVDFEHGLNLCIHEIRAALHDDANSPTYVETLPRRGYRFIGAVEPDVVPALQRRFPRRMSRCRMNGSSRRVPRSRCVLRRGGFALRQLFCS
jgi:DNA-binding winged helix-turn-helix (wHTH) protein